jgi:flavin reductase (DIM6/NTAB) family NADH-FMN oxidoreductase RutF
MTSTGLYRWPQQSLGEPWQALPGQPQLLCRPEEVRAEIARDSRWPAFFPCNIALVTTAGAGGCAIEKVVGASIVNRFPYIVALSFCRQPLSARHYVRGRFCETLESSGVAAIQFLPPGPLLDSTMHVIAESGDDRAHERLGQLALPTRAALTNPAPVLGPAFMVYEARLVRPGRDFSGDPLFPQPWVDAGSHRIYFLEIQAIQLREDIARGENQILWKSLPGWAPADGRLGYLDSRQMDYARAAYQKGFTANYAFPSAGTVAFERTGTESGMAVKLLPPAPKDQVEVDNDRARWPCFFPSSVGMITSEGDDGQANLMPCGSTTIVSRLPLVVAPCVSYAAINDRYAPRASLDLIRRRGRFVCGVPFDHPPVLDALRYCGSVSITADPNKVEHSGLEALPGPYGPVLPALPINFACEVLDEVRLGTHVMFLGRVKEIIVRQDVSERNSVTWSPWASLRRADSLACAA